METPVRELPIVAGQLALDFANTVDDPDGPARFDHLGTCEGLASWARRVGLLTADQGVTLAGATVGAADPAGVVAAGTSVDADHLLRRAHDLRRTLIAAFAPVAHGDAPGHWPELRAAGAAALARATLTSTGTTYALTWPDPADLLCPVAHAALDLLTGPDLARVKQCAGCPWLFVDRSKNGSRRWCAMDDCGKHEKIRKYVARRAARRRT